jgi:hypothetical protein
MSDDMDKKIKQIAEMLGQNQNVNIPDNVKGMLNMLMSSNGSKSDEPQSGEHHSSEDSTSSRHHSSGEDKKDMNDMGDAADLTRKMKKAMDMINTSSDPRMNLLNALRPYLNHERQKKLQKAVKFMRLGSLTKLLDDSEEHLI